MKFDPKLTAFNRRVAMAVRDVFSDDITAEQSITGKLCFRGPHPQDRTICTHVVVHLGDDVLAALRLAMPLQRETMIRNLVANLATQVRAKYDPDDVGQTALRIAATMDILQG